MFKDEEEGNLPNTEIINLNTINRLNLFKMEGYKNIGSKMVIKKFIALTLPTETCVNVEQYGGHSETLVPLISADGKCQTDTESTGGNGYGQP